MQADPIPVVRSKRPMDVVSYGSLPIGKVVPIWAGPMLREDAVTGKITTKIRMEETHEILINGMEARVMWYCVPWLAFARFENSREQFDRSYAGLPKIAGGATVPFFELAAAGAHGSNLIHKYLGEHAQPADQINTMFIEGYNIIDEYRAKNRSRDLPLRTRLQTDLAPAFWDHSRFAALVSDWDQQAMHAEVPLTVIDQNLRMKGLVYSGTAVGSGTYYRAATGDTSVASSTPGSGVHALGQVGTGADKIFAEMSANGITVSLANIDKAKKMKAFAEYRKGFDQIEDDHVVDMLMNGLTVEDQWLKNPILLAEGKTTLTQLQRFASADDLTESVVSGGGEVTLNVRCPQLSTGGVLMCLVEILPKQLFERQRNPFLHITNARYGNGELKDLPAYVRDTLDEEQVDVVFNKDIDVSHASPTGHFAYAPQNWKWAAWGPRVGGDLLRPVVNTVTDTLRREIYAVETANPAYAEDFLRAKVMHTKPFVDGTIDTFRQFSTGTLTASGLTVFGPMLTEASDNWEKVEEMSETVPIVKPA